MDEASIFFLFTNHVHQARDVGTNIALNIRVFLLANNIVLTTTVFISYFTFASFDISFLSYRARKSSTNSNSSWWQIHIDRKMRCWRKFVENLEKPLHVPHWCVDLLGAPVRIALFWKDFKMESKLYQIRNHLDFYDCLLLLYIYTNIGAHDRQK